MPVDPRQKQREKLNKQMKKKHKRQRWNKNKKKNWREIDLNDVEKDLEKKNLQLRTGGLVIDKKDSDLFMVDKGHEKTKLTTIEKARSKVLRVDKILGEPVEEKKTRVVKKGVKKNKKKVLPQKVSEEKQTQELGKMTDLWSCSSEEVSDKLFKVNSISKYTLKVNGQHKKPEHMMKAPKRVFSTAVEVAHAGSSYNPDFDEHQNLLRVENDREEKRLKKEEKVKRALHVDVKDYVTEEMRDAELKEGLFAVDSDEEEETEEAEGGVFFSTVTVPKNKRKRRREQMEKDQQREKEEQKSQRVRDNQVFRTKALIKEISEAKAASKAKQEKNQQIKDQTQPQLSYMKFEEPDQDLQLSSEISGSLRNLTPEGNIMHDRYKSLQKRCIIEPRKKFKNTKRDTKVKYQEKRDFRAITL